MLELSEWGIKDINELLWLDRPPGGNVSQAKELLKELGAIENEKITTRGKEMLQMPTHPRIAHLLIEAKHWNEKDRAFNYTSVATDVAAMLEERDPLQKEAGTDLALRVEALRKWRSKDFVNADKRVLERIERLAQAWRKLLNTPQDNQPPSHYIIGKLIAAAYPERIAKRIDKNGLRYRLSNGRAVKILEQDPLHREEFLAIAQLDAGSNEGKVFSAAALDPGDLSDLAIEKVNVRWDKERGMITGALEKCVGGIIISSKPVSRVEASSRIPILCDVIRDNGLKLLGWDENQENLQARIMSLRNWRPEENWPDVSYETLLDTLEDWLAPYLNDIYKASELQKLELNQIIRSMLPYELSVKLDKLAPAALEVPTGSMIKLKYFNDGSKIEMAVRLQEVFGLFETPTVNDGRNKVLMHLLSPGYKPVQVTQDLKSFWNKTYFEVRKDLLSRYPKHHWPQDPLTAEAVRGPKKRNK
jgi:ATP-dependent helicase HrpB